MKVIGLILATVMSVLGADLILTATLRMLPASVDALADLLWIILFIAQVSIACLTCVVFWRVFSAGNGYRTAYLAIFPLAYGAHLAATYNPPSFILVAVACAFVAVTVVLLLFYHTAWRIPDHE